MALSESVTLTIVIALCMAEQEIDRERMELI